MFVSRFAHIVFSQSLAFTVAVGALTVSTFGTLTGCARDAEPPAPERPPLFADVAESVGITHQHHKPVLDDKLSNIMSWMASVGASVAAADVDNDGFVDLFFTDSRKGEPNHLYLNSGNSGTPAFVDVASPAGLAAANDERGTSMDAIWGDVDNDGDADLYLVRWGHDSLYRNDGPGEDGVPRFTEITEERFRRQDGSPGTDWANGNAAIFFDFNRDGRLDIYVGNYFREVDLWDLETTRIMHDDFERARNGGSNFLYRQEEDGTFTEIAAELGVDDPGWTLAVGAGDLDGDGWPDLYCADDFGPDQLFLGQPGGSFVNVTESALGFDTKKGMNADFGDFNNDGWLDLYVTNITTAEYLQEGNMLWYNQGLVENANGERQLVLTDVSLESGTYDGGWGWGAKFFDYDNDGDLDVIAVNGFISAGEESYWYDLASWTVTGEHADDAANWPPIGDRSFSGYEKERLFRNDGLFSFTERAAAEGLETDRDGRGVAVLDYDNDGDLDVAIANQGQAPHLFENRLDQAPGAADRHYLVVELVTDPATPTNRDGVGTRVTLSTSSGILVRERDGGNGYSGQSDPRLHFGLGEIDRVPLLEVRWPDGGVQWVEDLAVDQVFTLRQDPSRYSEAKLEIDAPERRAVARESEAPAPPEIEPAELEHRLSELEAVLREGYERRAASAYRGLAADYGEHDRALDFLASRVAETNGSERTDFRIELSLAHVDKIPTCGGLAAIVCKGSEARKGLDQLDLALEERPGDWLAHYSRGMNHLHWPRALRHSAAAARDLEHALEIALEANGGTAPPYLERVYVALGQAYAKDGRYDEAREAWRRGLEHFPDHPELAEHLAVDSDQALLDLVKEKRSLELRLDTDLTFYDG